MLNRQNTIEKIYFSIGEVADMFQVNASLLRFWEKEFPQLQPRKNTRGNRMYSKKDIELFSQIQQLVREKGYTLEGAKNALKSKDSAANKLVVLERLQLVRQKLEDLAVSVQGA
jgi:DNA-binding transcriptional MerR regulator